VGLTHAIIGAFAGPALMWPVARLVTARQPRAFMYHRFSASEEPRHTSAALLREHIRIASEHHELVTFTELVRRCSRPDHKPKRPLLAITVDDGYRDFYQHAFPVFREMGVPATIFVTAGFVEHRAWLWPDAFHCLLFRSPAGRSALEFEGRRFDVDLTSDATRRNTWDTLATAVLYDTAARGRLLDALQRHVGLALPGQTPAEYEAMTWEEVRAVADGGIEVGGHTWSHAFLPDLPPTALEQELVGAKQLLESKTGHPVTSFAYPNGQAQDAPAALVEAVRRAGYECATVATPPSGDTARDWFRLGRWVAGDDLVNYRNILSGASALRQRLTSSR